MDTPVQSGGHHFPGAIVVIDSHTEGEPTRVVIDGWPEPEGDDMAARREWLAARHDHLRGAIINEPRGHAAMVGALLTCPVNPQSEAGVIFFNNVGYLGMCGHGLIGVVRTLQFIGRLSPGTVTLDTPVGDVSATLSDDGAVTIRNVPSHVHAFDVTVDVPGIGNVTGDIAYGGNWFFITHVPDVELAPTNLAVLTQTASAIQRALDDAGIGGDSARIDHVELTGPARNDDGDACNFVLCPGGEYDRSPCGTGTSAKLAVLARRGLLEPGAVWRQQSVTGGRFDAWYDAAGDVIIPHIRGHAHVVGETVLRFDPADPFRGGLASA